LSELPNSIEHLGVGFIQVSNNFLKKLFPNLKTLKLNGLKSDWRTIAPSILNSSIKYLDLIENRIDFLDYSVRFISLKLKNFLNTLILSRSHIFNLDSIGSEYFTEMTHLDSSYNKIEWILSYQLSRMLYAFLFKFKFKSNKFY
jgi:hypothetical protein